MNRRSPYSALNKTATCKRCGVEKPVSEFYQHWVKPGSRQQPRVMSWCRLCTRMEAHRRYWTAKFVEALLGDA